MTNNYVPVRRFPLYSPNETQPSTLGYILALSASSDNRFIAAAGQKNRGSNYIAMLDQQTLQFITFLGPEGLAHSSTITDLSAIEGAVFASTGRDGFMRVFDARTPAAAVWAAQLLRKGPEAEVNSVAFNGNSTLAVSAESEISLFDFRSQKPYFVYNELHAEPVTKLRFPKAGTSLLVSASEDGMIAVLDTADLVNEDEGQAPVAAMNTGNGVRDFRSIADNQIWAFSATESVSVWDAASGLPLGGLGEGSVREHPLLSLDGSLGYVLDVFRHNETGESVILAGNSEGGLAMLNADKGLGLAGVFGQGHDGVVRASLAHNGRLWTGGEDGVVILWGEASAEIPGGAGGSGVGPKRGTRPGGLAPY